MTELEHEEPSKGIIQIESCYTICHLCGNILIRTFVEDNDISRAAAVYIICNNCIKTLPEVVQERLRNPAQPKIYR